MEFAEGSFLQIVVGGGARIVTGRIERVEMATDLQDLVHGEITLGEVRGVDSDESRPSRFAVGFAQYPRAEARIKSGSQGWNGVEITHGVCLILALAEDRTQAEALAVRQIKSPNDPFVQEVRWCVEAERHTAPAERLALVRDSLVNGHGLVTAWGHYCAGRLNRIPRAEAVPLELGLLNNEKLDDHDRLAAAQNLELELWKSGDSDDALNQEIVGAFLSNLSPASRALRVYLMDALQRVLFTNAPSGPPGEAYRKQLRLAVFITAEPAIVEALNKERGEKATGRAADQLLQWLEH